MSDQKEVGNSDPVQPTPEEIKQINPDAVIDVGSIVTLMNCFHAHMQIMAMPQMIPNKEAVDLAERGVAAVNALSAVLKKGNIKADYPIEIYAKMIEVMHRKANVTKTLVQMPPPGFKPKLTN